MYMYMCTHIYILELVHMHMLALASYSRRPMTKHKDSKRYVALASELNFVTRAHKQLQEHASHDIDIDRDILYISYEYSYQLQSNNYQSITTHRS